MIRACLPLVIVFGVATAGCWQDRCGSEGADAPSLDAATNDDASDCAQPVALLQLGYAGAPTCAGGALAVSVFDRAGTLVREGSATCVAGTAISEVPPLPPGDYLLALRTATQILAGGELLHDANCPSLTIGACAPIETQVRPCTPTLVPFSVPCDPLVTDCPGGA